MRRGVTEALGPQGRGSHGAGSGLAFCFKRTKQDLTPRSL